MHQLENTDMPIHMDENGQNLGTWTWNANDRKLLVRASATSPAKDLAGDWTLDAIGVQLDGLSRSRLARTLATGAGDVSCALGLSDGLRVRLIGAFDADGNANGGLLREVATSPGAVPGPVLEPVYQPIISLSTGRTAGFEALARWSKNTDASFEDPALASNMLIHAAQTLSNWHKGTGRTDLFVQVNLTARDLASSDVANLIEVLVQGYELPTGTIRVELTEQAALRDIDRALETVEAIKKAGASLILDDFGSGHSSFAWLADMPAEALKIDPDLTRRIGDERTEHILEAITLLASRLGMSVTAEGVEDKSMIAKLRQLSFTYVQGYAFSRPLQAEAALAFLKAEDQLSD